MRSLAKEIPMFLLQIFWKEHKIVAHAKLLRKDPGHDLLSSNWQCDDGVDKRGMVRVMIPLCEELRLIHGLQKTAKPSVLVGHLMSSVHSP